MATTTTVSEADQQELLSFLTQPDTIANFVNECRDVGQKAVTVGDGFIQVQRDFADIVKDFPDIEQVYSPKWDGLIDHWKTALWSSRDLAVKTASTLREYNLYLGLVSDIETQEDLKNLQQELQRYATQHPMETATTVTEKFKALRNDVQQFSEGFGEYTIKQEQILTEEAKGYKEGIKKYQVEIDELSEKIQKELKVFDLGYLFAFSIPSLPVSAGVIFPNKIARGRAQNDLNAAQAKLKHAIGEQKPPAVTQAGIEVLKPDIDDICTKLAAIASIWDLPKEQVTQINTALDEGISVIKKKTFQLKLSLLRAQVEPLRAGMEQYVAQVSFELD